MFLYKHQLNSLTVHLHFMAIAIAAAVLAMSPLFVLLLLTVYNYCTVISLCAVD